MTARDTRQFLMTKVLPEADDKENCEQTTVYCRTDIDEVSDDRKVCCKRNDDKLYHQTDDNKNIVTHVGQYIQ